MPLYRVRMTRNSHQSVDIEVLAADRYQAEELAYEIALHDPNLEWCNENWVEPPYPDKDNIEEIKLT